MLLNKEIIDNLTVEQKLSLLAGRYIDGLPFFSVSNLEDEGSGNKNNVTFPSFNSIANSWNTELIAKISTELAVAAKKTDLNVVVSPDVSVKMHPYSSGMTEDPYLCGKLASAYKKGIAKAAVLPILSNCSIKNNDIDFMDIEPNKRIIRDYVAKPFEIALKENGSGAVMTTGTQLKGSYRDVNINVISEILQNKKYFSALAVCEKTDAESVGKCLLAGNTPLFKGDIEPLEKAYSNYLQLKASLEKGAVTLQEFEEACNDGTVLCEATINAAVERLLNFARECEKCAASVAADSEISLNNLSLLASQESVVLLKNEGNVLPLGQKTRVAVIGQPAATDKAGEVSFAKNLSINKDNLPFVYSGFARGFNLGEQRSDELISEACILAASCDAVLLFLGSCNENNESLSESPALKLAVNQLALIDSLRKTGKKLIAVICGDYPLDTSFDSDCDALLLVPSGGSYCNEALIEILSGAKNPSGRLAYSFYDETDKIFADLKKRKDSRRIKVGPFFGYRYYDTADIKVKYPFGHGLSYTKFTYSKIKADANSVRFRVKNTGTQAGCETMQLYIGKNESSVARPSKELRGFNRVYLLPGQSKTVTININFDNFGFCDSKDGERKIEHGIYTAYIGSSVSDIRLKKSFKVTGVKFNDKKESLSDYIYSKTNIVSGRYVMQTDNTQRKKVSKAIIFFILMLCLTGVYDIIFAIAGVFNLVSIIILIILNTFIPIAVVGLILEDKKRLKQSISQLVLSKTGKENETVLNNEPSLEKLFLEEFSEKEELDEIIQEKEEIEENVAQSDANISLKSVAEQLVVFMNERGVSPEISSVRALLSAMYSTRMIFLKSSDPNFLQEFILQLSAYFGSPFFADDLRTLESNNDLFKKSEEEQSVESAASKAVTEAASNKNLICFSALNEVSFPQSEQLLLPIVSFLSSRESEGTSLQNDKSKSDKNLALPSNLWFILTLAQGGFENVSPYFIQNAVVVDVKLRKTNSKNEPIDMPKINLYQFLKLCEKSEKNCAVSEELCKKLDRLEEYANTVKPYRIGNKQWRRIEKFLSVYLACGGTESEAVESVAAAKLFPQIVPLIKTKADGESDFSFEIKKIFGEENTLRV